MASQEFPDSLAPFEDQYQDMDGPSDISESSDVEQLDGSKEKKVKEPKEDKKDKQERLKKRSEELPDQSNFEAVSLYGLARGLQLGPIQRSIDNGFPFPKYLENHGVTTQNWGTFMEAIQRPLQPWSNSGRGLAYELESILDIVSRWDSEWFRKRGIVLRMDMPGEERYGLDFMDLYYEELEMTHTIKQNPKKQTYNMAARTAGNILKGKMKDAKPEELKSIRQLMFGSNRLVIDRISVLDDKPLYEKHGWARWDKQCLYAKKGLLNLPKEKPVLVDNEPWDFREMERPTRKDRWPPSKHFNYERYRGRFFRWVTYSLLSIPNGGCVSVAHHYSFFVPDGDSMDQRDPDEYEIIPCDELPRRIFQAKPLYNILNDTSLLPK